MLVEILQWKISFLVLFAKRVHTLIPSYASFADVGYIRCSGVTGKLKEDNKFKCQTGVNQQIDIT